MSHRKDINESRHISEWVMSRISMRHVMCMSHMINMIESSFTRKNWNIWVRHVTNIHESSWIHQWVTLYTWMSHVTNFNALCHMCQWVMSRTFMSHDMYMNESCHIHVNKSCHAQFLKTSFRAVSVVGGSFGWIRGQVWSRFDCNTANKQTAHTRAHVHTLQRVCSQICTLTSETPI